MKKRLLALLLIVMMLVQTLPMNALATEASGALSGTEATRATISTEEPTEEPTEGPTEEPSENKTRETAQREDTSFTVTTPKIVFPINNNDFNLVVYGENMHSLDLFDMN